MRITRKTAFKWFPWLWAAIRTWYPTDCITVKVGDESMFKTIETLKEFFEVAKGDFKVWIKLSGKEGFRPPFIEVESVRSVNEMAKRDYIEMSPNKETIVKAMQSAYEFLKSGGCGSLRLNYVVVTQWGNGCHNILIFRPPKGWKGNYWKFFLDMKT